MKLVFLTLLLALGVFAIANENNGKKFNKNLKITESKVSPVAVGSTSTSNVPCDTKEDIFKKLEEQKKAAKPFSLQGGNKGCSVDEKK